MWIHNVLVLCLCLPSVLTEREHFAGGSLSFKFLDRQTSPHKIKLTIITAWTLGEGPCGPSCNIQDVGHSTETVRLDVINKHGVDWFGNWTAEVKYPHSHVSENKTQLVAPAIKGQISTVNTPLRWEQEVADVTLDIDSTSEYTDISLSGLYWRPLDYKEVLHATHTDLVKKLKYRLQVKTYPHNRNDTGKPNNSPIVIFKPVYTVRLNSVTTIQLTAADEDDDLVRCQSDATMTAGGLMHFENSNIQVFENCTILISGHETEGCREGGVGAVAVRVSDYNRHDMVVEGQHPRTAGESIRSLSDMSVQFMYVTVQHTDMPQFVAPTKENQHTFCIHMGSTLNIPLYAKPSSSSTTSDGLERSYIVVVKDISLTTFKAPIGIVPYFAFLPESVLVTCPLEATCSFPVYSASSSARTISEVELTLNPFTDVTVSTPKVITQNGENVYVSDIAITSHSGGSEELCLRATDDTGAKSKTECILIVTVSPDPCDSRPCKNGGRCERKDQTFVCHCQAAYTGPSCETEVDPCVSKPCKYDGKCFDALGQPFCQCKRGYAGKFCETNVDDCKVDSCSGHGVCKDGINSVQCQCVTGYTGERCETRVSECDTWGCSNGGQCRIIQDQPTCHCPVHYTGTHCQSDAMLEGASGKYTMEARFIVPTLVNGSVIPCDIAETCNIELFLYPVSGDMPLFTITTQGDELITDVTDPVPEKFLGLHNTFYSVLSVIPSSAGTYTVCVHAQSERFNDDERCYIVTAQNTAIHVVATGLSKFLPPSPPNRSKISCYRATPCHVLFHTDRHQAGQCSVSPQDGSAIGFDVTSTSATSCHLDVLFLPNSERSQTCISVGVNGEERCFEVQITEQTKEILQGADDGSETSLSSILVPSILVPLCLAILAAVVALLYSKYGCPCSRKNSVHTSKERLEQGLEEDDLRRRKKEILAALNGI